MKKSIKIILIILGVAGIAVGLTLLQKRIFPDPGRGKSPKRTYYSVLSDKINDGWDGQTQWNAKLYDSLTNAVIEERKSNNIREKDEENLLGLNTTLAVGVIHNFFDTEMKAPNSREALVIANYKGIATLKASLRDGSAKNDPRFSELESMYQAYISTLEFSRKSFNVSAEVDENIKWKSYQPYRQHFQNEKDRLGSGKYFKSHFKNINSVKNFWTSFDTKLKEAERQYYLEIGKAVKSRLSSIYDDSYRKKNSRERTYYSPAIDEANKYIDNNYADSYDVAMAKLNEAESQLRLFVDELPSRLELITDAQTRYIDETQGLEGTFPCDGDTFYDTIKNVRSISKNVEGLLEKLASKKKEIQTIKSNLQ